MAGGGFEHDPPSHRPPLSRTVRWVVASGMLVALTATAALYAQHHDTRGRVMLAGMGTGADVYQELRVDSGASPEGAAAAEEETSASAEEEETSAAAEGEETSASAEEEETSAAAEGGETSASSSEEETSAAAEGEETSASAEEEETSAAAEGGETSASSSEEETSASGAPAAAPEGEAESAAAAAAAQRRGRGWKADPGQKNLELWRHDMSREEWPSFGKRGSAMGSIKTPKVSSLIQRAATDCGQDPRCSCDWAGMPRECLYNYCCGTIAHHLGQGRADYGTDALGMAANPTPAERVDAFQQEKHLQAWQSICTPDQDLYGMKCSSEGVPELDNRKH